MSASLRLFVLSMALASSQTLEAQVRTTTLRDPVLTTKTLTPIATVSLPAMGGTGVISNVVVRASADQVKVFSGSLIGSVGEMALSAPIPGAGIPGSRLTILSDGALPAGSYTVSVGFTHVRPGDELRFVDGNTGAALTTCSLVQQSNYNNVQTCTAALQLSGSRLNVLVDPTKGVQVWPTQITVSQLR